MRRRGNAIHGVAMGNHLGVTVYLEGNLPDVGMVGGDGATAEPARCGQHASLGRDRCALAPTRVR